MGFLRQLPLLLLITTVQAWQLDVGTSINGSDVVAAGVATPQWSNAATREPQPCSQYWTTFHHYPNFTVSKNTTFVSSTPDSIATAHAWSYRDNTIRVQLNCHASGNVTTNLTFVNNVTGQAVSVFWDKTCVVYPVWYQLGDPGNVAMMLLAIALVVWGGLRVENAVARQIQQEMGEDAEISIYKAVGFVIGASASLLLIFYFLKMMNVLLTISFCFVATVAISMVLYSIIQPTSVGARLSQINLPIPVIGNLTGLELSSVAVAVVAVVVWVVTRHWVANNILGMSICLYMMTVLRLPSLKVAAVLLCLLFFYDIFWVFYSKLFFGKNVMVTAAKGLDLPIKLLMPRGVTTPCYGSSYTMLGLGDIALPGLLGVFCRRFDLANPSSKVAYFYVFSGGYATGILVTFVVLFVFKAAQPALLYLVPGTLGSVAITAATRGQFKALWEGLQANPSPESTQAETSDQGDEPSVAHSSMDILEESQVETAPMLVTEHMHSQDKEEGDDMIDRGL